jgi:tRNA pseudouridine55 synthase
MLDTSGYDFTVSGLRAPRMREGQAIARLMCAPDVAIAAVLPAFTGPIDQVPPAYLALDVAGRWLRAGEVVAPATATILKPERYPATPSFAARLPVPGTYPQPGAIWRWRSATVGYHMRCGALRAGLQV